MEAELLRRRTTDTESHTQADGEISWGGMMPGRFKAVLIGNGEFPDEPKLRALRCAIRDVEGFCEVLSSETHGPDGPYEVELLRNESHGVIIRKIFQVLNTAQQDDLVLIYYSGHGKLDSRGELYLASCDTTSELLPASSVPIERIKSFVRLSKAKRVVWIMDCCFSGAVEKLFKGDIADQASQTIQSSLDDGCGTYILTASTSVQMAEEKEGDEYSVFTKYLISGIKEGEADKDDDGYVSIQELFEYLRSQVPKDGQQEPRGWFLNTAGRLNIAKTGKPARAVWRQELREKILDAAKTAHLPELHTRRQSSVAQAQTGGFVEFRNSPSALGAAARAEPRAFSVHCRTLSCL